MQEDLRGHEECKRKQKLLFYDLNLLQINFVSVHVKENLMIL